MHRSFPQLVASVCLLAVWIATPILSVAHLALEAHSYCAEHERLEDMVHDDSQHQDNAVASHSSFNLPDLPGEREGEHEECAFAEEFTREYLLSSPSDRLDTPPPTLVASGSLLQSSAEATADLLLLAPKNSPPFAT